MVPIKKYARPTDACSLYKKMQPFLSAQRHPFGELLSDEKFTSFQLRVVSIKV
jgi:hypothetical protein